MSNPDDATKLPVENQVSCQATGQCVRISWYGFGPPHTVCLFRILIGIYFLIGWLSVLPWVTFFYSSQGVPFPLFNPSNGELKSIYDLVAVLIQPPPPWLAWILYVFMLVLSVLIIVGCNARTALTIYAIMFVYYWLLHLHTINTSYDRLAFISTMILAMSECDAVFSLDAWGRKKRGGPQVEQIPVWPGRLIAMQIAFMYVGTGIYKIIAPSWNDGAILQYSLQGDWGSPIAFWLIQFDWSRTLCDAAVLLTILIEVWAPFMLFHPKLKVLFFFLGFFFHLGIALTLNIWGFLFMPLTYILFVDPLTCKRFCDRIDRARSVP